MAKLFVSLPMANQSVDDIHADMKAIAEMVAAEMDCSFDVIDTVWQEDPPTDICDKPESLSAWYLGKSINALSEADLVVFAPDWAYARGCIVEHMVCALYNIPYVDMAAPFFDGIENDEVNDYTVDYNEAARINEVLSEAYEDAIGFEHDNVDDLAEIEDDEELLYSDELEPGEYDADK